jgi:hypothetical protein
MNQPLKKDNEFIVSVQIIIDGQQHAIESIKVVTPEPDARSSYNKIKNDQTEAYKKLYPNSSIVIVILSSQRT